MTNSLILLFVAATICAALLTSHSHLGSLSSRPRVFPSAHEIASSRLEICAFRRCVISYSVFGTSPRYVRGALYNADLQPIVFPGWKVRVYHDLSLDTSIARQLKDKGVELVLVTEPQLSGGFAGTFWRYFVADDANVDIYIIRDIDSRLSSREKAAVDEWLASNFSFHAIRDHPNHNVPLMGGLWGGRAHLPVSMRSLIEKFFDKNAGFGHDQDFLTTLVWPLIANRTLSHDSYLCSKFPNSVSFPTQRQGWEIVGGVFSGDNIFRFEDVKQIPNDPKCRRHPDWLYG